MTNYLIIGTGPAGISASEAIREIDSVSDITFVGDELYGFYSRPGLAYYLTGELTERQLFPALAKPFRHIQTRVVSLHPREHYVEAEDGRRLGYDKLLIATGSSASKLSIPGSDLKGVVKLDNLDDAKTIMRMARQSQAAVVIGGGITALEIVEALVANGTETHYLLRSDRYWPNILDEAESAIVEKRLKEHGVHLHHQSQQSRILGDRDKVAGVETESGEVYKCQLVAIAVGVQPRIELAKAAGLQTEKGILTDQFLRTSTEDVYAAGDVVQALDPISGKTVLETLWGNSVTQGRIAGKNMAGEPTAFRKGVAFNVTRLAGLTTTIIGAVGQGKDADLLSLSRGDSESWRQLPNVMAVQCDSAANRTRIMLGARSIVGALVMGDQTLSLPLQQLISKKVDVTPIRQQLSSPECSLVNTIIEFWTNWSRNLEMA